VVCYSFKMQMRRQKSLKNGKASTINCPASLLSPLLSVSVMVCGLLRQSKMPPADRP
jgi:hypothetical protein